MTSSTTISLVGIVKAVMTCTLVQVGPNKFTVHEVSNVREGYKVILSTDGRGKYDGVTFHEDGLITSVDHQDVSTDKTKVLEFTSQPTYVAVTCESNE